MQKIISFSVAAYNIEPYAKKLLDSFVDEKVMDKFEVLIVNDGSKDRTIDVCQDYVNRYPSVFRLVDKENGGHGSTINKGIELAEGKYFKPIDGDDWIKTSNLPEILWLLERNDADVVVTDYEEVYERSGRLRTVGNHFLPRNKVLRFDSVRWRGYIVFHSLMYRTSLLQSNRIRLTERIFYEDTEYDLYPIVHADTVLYIPRTLYCYRLEREGQSVSISGMIKNRDDYRTMMTNVFLFCKEWEGRVSKRKRVYFMFLQRTALMFFYRISIQREWKSDPELSEYKRRLKDELRQIDKKKFNRYWMYSVLRVGLSVLVRKINGSE